MSNNELDSILDKVYRPDGLIGNKSTADAISVEKIVGKPVGENVRGHIKKGEDMSNALNNRMQSNPTATSNDYNAAADVYNDLQRALNN